ncbi:hypothetical protein GN244_ATG20416 [Phytophthora infestans]|uniref:Uncharacterized protein n=1 Tax=Phytophthora infestans TaxID=4787 RepID=A0A833SGY1_PHYIN|nr:hypothetical protein GN244_ATG20416 [Phytophthora infestans]
MFSSLPHSPRATQVQEKSKEKERDAGHENATEDTPTSQDAKTLVPIVAKKEKILQMEVAKLGKLLAQRNEMLDGLQESHEYLLTTNGQLQERSRLRRERLVSLRTLLEAGQEQHGKDKTGVCDVIGVNELDATAEKCGVLKGIILGWWINALDWSNNAWGWRNRQRERRWL